MYSESVVVELVGVSKHFEIYEHPRDQLKQLLKPMLDKLWGKSRENYFTDFRALKSVSLNIKKGESVGLIGRNGSGKSTMLQIITGTLPPTKGTVNTFGRIGALLELGSGFNPEFTGRENILVSAAILGLSDDEILSRIDSIITFADIGEHLDRPVRTYSSGMLVRLAFAVQVRLDPDILIIDEALAVGDALFQKKCMDELKRMNERGVTLIVVSHDANSIKNICNRALLLEDGQVLASGEVKSVFNQYELLLHSLENAADKVTQIDSIDHVEAVRKNESYGGSLEKAVLIEFTFKNSSGEFLKTISHGERLFVNAKISFNKNIEAPAYGLLVRDIYGRSIYEASTYSMRRHQKIVQCGDVVTVVFDFKVILGVGRYYFSLGIANKGTGQSEFEEHILLKHDIAALEVIQSDEDYFFGGVVDLQPNVRVDAERVKGNIGKSNEQ